MTTMCIFQVREIHQEKPVDGTKEPYLDIYKATYNANGTISDAVAVDNINTKWHDGPSEYIKDGTTMYYGSESFNEKSLQR